MSFIFVCHKINCFYTEGGNIHIFCTHIFMHHLENIWYATLVMQYNYLLPAALCLLCPVVTVGRTLDHLCTLTPWHCACSVCLVIAPLERWPALLKPQEQPESGCLLLKFSLNKRGRFYQCFCVILRITSALCYDKSGKMMIWKRNELNLMVTVTHGPSPVTMLRKPPMAFISFLLMKMYLFWNWW